MGLRALPLVLFAYATMIQLQYKPVDQDVWLLQDVKRIQSVLAERGYAASDEDVRQAWEAYSDSYAATWLTLPLDDTNLFEAVMIFLEPAPHSK